MNRLAPGFWSELFGNSNPVEIEIGPGGGAFLLSVASLYPATNYFAIERAWRRFRALEEVLRKRTLPNARLLGGDAWCVMENLLPDGCVAAYHIYFPDPWWKTRHHKRRHWTPTFAANLARTLEPGGVVYFASDVEIVDTLAREALLGSTLFTVDPERRSPRAVTTSFERKGLARGAKIHHAVFVKRPT